MDRNKLLAITFGHYYMAGEEGERVLREKVSNTEGGVTEKKVNKKLAHPFL